jgi:hypothetical protein
MYCILGCDLLSPPSALRVEAGGLSERLALSTTQAGEEPHVRLCYPLQSHPSNSY